MAAVDSWRLAAVGSLRLATGGGWRLAVCRVVAFGGWRLVVPGGCPEHKNISGFLRTPLKQCRSSYQKSLSGPALPLALRLPLPHKATLAIG